MPGMTRLLPVPTDEDANWAIQLLSLRIRW